MENVEAFSSEKKMALFFFFIFLDDRLAAKATDKALDLLKKRAARKSLNTQLIIATSIKVYHLISKHNSVLSSTPLSGAFSIPKSVDMGPWRQFRKQSDIMDVMTVAWCQVLQASLVDVAKGMQTSQGTVQYRLASGLKFLGTMAPLGAFRAGNADG